jgi:hypothetical protein
MSRLSAPPRAATAAWALGLGALLWLSPAWSADQVTIRPDSPSQYTVVEGDTLWDIAGQFLEQPWLWPEVWQINPQIQNPDLIYPGDVIELTYVDGNPVLRLSRADAPNEMRTVRLSPQVRREPFRGAVPAIPLERISAFLSQSSVLSEDDIEAAAYVLGGREGQTILGSGDELLARGNWATGVAVYDIVRQGRVLRDPDSNDRIGVEGVHVGVATLARSDDDQATFTVTDIELEVRPGDHLIPRAGAELQAEYFPTPPRIRIDAAIISIGQGHSVAGRYDTLLINVGADDGLAVGNLLTVREPDLLVEDEFAKRNFLQWLNAPFVPRGTGNPRNVTFSGETVASVLVYKVFDDASLALVLDSSDAIRLNDRVVTPQ